MILLDTNIVSESFRPQPDRNVLIWLDRQPVQSLYICSPVLAELYYGVARLPQGKRKESLLAAIDRIEHDLFRGRVLPFDAPAAAEYGRLAARQESVGRALQQMDALVAAIASVNRLALATRNTKDFDGLGVEIINPFNV